MQEKAELYKQILSGSIDRMAELLDEGKSLEIQRSRSGLKMYSYRKAHETVYNKIHKQEKGEE